MPKTIKINKNLATLLAKDNQWLKALSVFYPLKFLYSGGIILNISKRYGEISSILDISESNLRKKIRFLKDQGFIEHKNNNLVFVSFDKIKTKFEIKTHKSHKLEYKNPKDFYILLKTLAIKENLEKQEFKLQERIILQELKKFGKIQAKSIRNKIRKKIKENIGFLTEKLKQREPLYSLNNNYSKSTINPDITLSRNKIAYLFGRKSKSSGSRFIKKAKTNGLILRDEKRINKIQSNVHHRIIRSLDLDSSYFIFKRNLYQRLSNNLTLSNFIA